MLTLPIVGIYLPIGSSGARKLSSTLVHMYDGLRTPVRCFNISYICDCISGDAAVVGSYDITTENIRG
jgi:hypothetical protein